MICVLFCIYGDFPYYQEIQNLPFIQSLKYTEQAFLGHQHIRDMELVAGGTGMNNSPGLCPHRVYNPQTSTWLTLSFCSVSASFLKKRMVI